MRQFLILAAALCASGCSGEGDAVDEAPEVAQTDTPAPVSDDGATAAVENWLNSEYGEYGTVTYAMALRDLNGDGQDEAVVYAAGPAVCGSGGCNAIVLTQGEAGWAPVMNASVSRTPITLLDTSSNGWRDLTVEIAGGGGPAGTVRMQFDGTSYPSNPTVLPDALGAQQGEELIAAEPEYLTLSGD